MAPFPHYVIAYPADGSRVLVREVEPARARQAMEGAWKSGLYARVAVAKAFVMMSEPGRTDENLSG